MLRESGRWAGEDDGRAGEEADGRDDETRRRRPRGDASRHGSEDRAQVHRRRASCRRSWSAPRDWRTREDPFVEHWPEVEARLSEAPDARGEDALRDAASRSTRAATTTGQLRTLQRRVEDVARRAGPGEGDRPRAAAPARARPRRRTSRWATELGVTIAGAGIRAHALRVRAAVLQLAVGDGVPVRVDRGAATGRAAGAVPARARAASATRPTTRRRRRIGSPTARASSTTARQTRRSTRSTSR